MNSSALYGIHGLDGLLNVLQRLIIDRYERHGGHDEADETPDDHVRPAGDDIPANDGLLKYVLQHIMSVWRDQRVTLTFLVELVALGSKFLFHLTLFIAVFSLYGLPINIIRDFYMAFNKLKLRLIAFSSYRRLTSNMDSRFESVTTEEELDAAGRICIICRDRMEVRGIHGDCKKLPMCNHTFHKYCLREWLVQQQNCPTCRGDIQANEARAKALAQQKASEEHDLSAEEETAGKKEEVPSQSSSDVHSGWNSFPYPLLCEVIEPQGTTLFKIRRYDSQQINLEPLRRLKAGSLVICTARLECHEDSDNLDSSSYHNFMKTPGGCISSTDLKELLQLRPLGIKKDSN
jgi:hypothetical protein